MDNSTKNPSLRRRLGSIAANSPGLSFLTLLAPQLPELQRLVPRRCPLRQVLRSELLDLSAAPGPAAAVAAAGRAAGIEAD